VPSGKSSVVLVVTDQVSVVKVACAGVFAPITVPSILPAFISTVPSPVTSIIFIAFSELISPTTPADATIFVADIEPVSKLSAKVENVPVVSFQPNLTLVSEPLLIQKQFQLQTHLCY